MVTMVMMLFYGTGINFLQGNHTAVFITESAPSNRDAYEGIQAASYKGQIFIKTTQYYYHICEPD